MNKIKFNNTEFQVESYNRNTYFSGDSITDNADCTLVMTDVAALRTLASTPITSIQITHNDALIYNLTNVEGQIRNVNEYLNEDRMNIGVNINFSTPEIVEP